VAVQKDVPSAEKTMISPMVSNHHRIIQTNQGFSLGHKNNFMKANITRGVRGELLAAEWLVSQGIWAFLPPSAQGPVDLVGLDKDGKVYLFDVKVLNRRKDGTKVARVLSPIQKKLGVKLLYVDIKTKQTFIGGSQGRDKKGMVTTQMSKIK
jgi:hypothetical protein